MFAECGFKQLVGRFPSRAGQREKNQHESVRVYIPKQPLPAGTLCILCISEVLCLPKAASGPRDS